MVGIIIKKKYSLYKFLNKLILSIFIVFLLLFTLSCYSEYVSMNYKVHHGACWNNQHTKIAFIISKGAYKSAKGVSRFPDGGIPEYLIEKVDLYVLNTKNNNLKKAVGFDDLADFLGYSRSSWKTRIAYTDSMIYYKVSPIMDWDWHLKHAETTEDLKRIKELKKKYSEPHSFNEKTEEVKKVNPSFLQSVYQKRDKADLSDLNDRLSKLPLSELGLNIKEIYPKTDDEYIEETIYVKNKSSVSRRAVIEQIISKLKREEIKSLIKKMDEYKKNLEGRDKAEYERYSEHVYEKLKSML